MIIINRTRNKELQIDQERLSDISSRILLDEGSQNCEFTLSFLQPSEIKKLNKSFRQINEVTDVLSFPADDEIDPETGTPFLGDILICVDRAAEQASQSGHALQNEIELLLIHGLLHLHGYDHAVAEDQTEMWALQNHYLEAFGIQLGRNPGDEFDF